MTYKNFSFRHFAILSSFLTAIAGFLYSLTFFWASHTTSHLVTESNYKFLLLTGLLSLAVLVHLYQLLKSTEESFALWALVLGVLGVAGSMIHGGYGLATTISIPTGGFSDVNQVDPRGLLTFGLTGLSIFSFGYLMWRSQKFRMRTYSTAKLLGVLLVGIYLLRLWAPDSGATFTKDLAGLVGFVIAPAWYLMLAAEFKKR